jgi:hypothetical protein
LNLIFFDTITAIKEKDDINIIIDKIIDMELMK